MNLPATIVASHPVATIGINGTPTRFTVDSGALFSPPLTQAAARRLHLSMGRLPAGMSVGGITGNVDASLTTVKEVSLPKGTLHDVDFIVWLQAARDAGIMDSARRAGGMIHGIGHGKARMWPTSVHEVEIGARKSPPPSRRSCPGISAWPPFHPPTGPSMNTKNIISTLVGASISLCAASTHSAAIDVKRKPFSGVDISGIYACTGNDAQDGDFKTTMTVSLDAKYSDGKHGSFKVEVKGDPDTYTGSIVTDGQQLAMDFANADPAKKDFGIALATVTVTANGKFHIEKFYYEPQYGGGSNGFESCSLQ